MEAFKTGNVTCSIMYCFVMDGKNICNSVFYAHLKRIALAYFG